MEDEKIAQLKTVYDELWSDAKTMIKDMNNNITVVFLFGLAMLAIAPMELGTVVQMYARITAGSTRWLDYFYLIATSFGSVISAVAGVAMIRWYYKLKNRYARVIQLEKTFED
jgi:membrane protein YqaA with SNARE-associated domain